MKPICSIPPQYLKLPQGGAVKETVKAKLWSVPGVHSLFNDNNTIRVAVWNHASLSAVHMMIVEELTPFDVVVMEPLEYEDQ